MKAQASSQDALHRAGIRRVSRQVDASVLSIDSERRVSLTHAKPTTVQPAAASESDEEDWRAVRLPARVAPVRPVFTKL